MPKKKTNENKKPATEKKERKQRAVMRSRKDSPAGHFADRLAANVKQRADIMKAVANFPGVSDDLSVGETVGLLNGLAEKNFAPARKSGGRKAVTFAPGQKVYLNADAVGLLKQFFPILGVTDETEFFVSDGYTAQPKDSQLPLRIGSSALDAPPVGFISKKSVGAQPFATAS
jgi:hypothetical protein